MSNRRQRRASERRSRSVQQNVIGVHAVDNSRRASKIHLSFSSHHESDKANRGDIRQLIPDTKYRESESAFSRRISDKGFAMRSAHTARVRAIVCIVALVLIAIGVAVAVAWFSLTSSITSRMTLNDSDLKQTLVAPSNASDPYYVLVAGEFSDASSGYDGPDLLTLIRIDPTNHQVSLISIPGSTDVTLSKGETGPIRYAQLKGGDAGLVSAVSSFAGVSIAHYAKIDASGFQTLVDDIGGVSVNLPQEVDDPDAGSIYLSAGQQTLDGASALTAVRADNYSDTVAMRSTVQNEILETLMQTLLGHGTIDMAQDIDSIASCFKTDMNIDQLTAAAQAFGSNVDSSYLTHVPGRLYKSGDTVLFEPSDKAWTNMMAATNDGDDPDRKMTTGSVSPSDVTVTVRNGAGTTGAATAMSTTLTNAGYQVPTTGNTDSYVYDDTLVVYGDVAYEDTAQSIVDTLGTGRVVEASYYYSFDTDILVIIGKDWVPTS